MNANMFKNDLLNLLNLSKIYRRDKSILHELKTFSNRLQEKTVLVYINYNSNVEEILLHHLLDAYILDAYNLNIDDVIECVEKYL